MSTRAEENEARIQGMTKAELLTLWGDIRDGRELKGWASGKAMEYLFLRAFQIEGATVRWPYSVGFPLDGTGGRGFMEQIDGAIYIDSLCVLVETKDVEGDGKNKEKGIEPIAKLRNQLMRRPGSVIGVVFSRSGFSVPAKILAHFTAPQTILLWEGSEFEIGLRGGKLCEGMRLKYRYAVERAIPNYNLTVANEWMG